MSNIKDSYSNTGCIRCGDCCETFLMDEDFVNAHRFSFQRIVIREERHPGVGQIWIHTTDEKCVFLFPDNKCSIYSERPLIPCRIMGVPNYLECPVISPDGKKRSKAEYDKIQNKNCNSAKYSPEYKKLITEHSRKTAEKMIEKMKLKGI